MKNCLTYRNGYRFGHLPISYEMAQIIFRMQARESMQSQCKAFKMIMEGA